jgi:hypothetical protein
MTRPVINSSNSCCACWACRSTRRASWRTPRCRSRAARTPLICANRRPAQAHSPLWGGYALRRALRWTRCPRGIPSLRRSARRDGEGRFAYVTAVPTTAASRCRRIAWQEVAGSTPWL